MKKTIIASAILGAMAFAGLANANGVSVSSFGDLDINTVQYNGDNYVHADAFSIFEKADGDITALANAIGNSISVHFDGVSIDENASDVDIIQRNGTVIGAPTLQYSTSHVLFSKGAEVTSAAFSKGNAITVSSSDDSTHELNDYDVTQVNGVLTTDDNDALTGKKNSAQNAYASVFGTLSQGDTNVSAVAVGNGVDVVLNNHLGDQISEESDYIDQRNLSTGQYAEAWASGGTTTTPEGDIDIKTIVRGDLTTVARAAGNDIKLIAVPDTEGGAGGDSHELESMTQRDVDSFQSASSFVGGYIGNNYADIDVSYYSVYTEDMFYQDRDSDHWADRGNIVIDGDSTSVATAVGNSIVLIGDAIVQDDTQDRGESVVWTQVALGQGVGDYYHHELLEDYDAPSGGEDGEPAIGTDFDNVFKIAEYTTHEDFGIGETALAVTKLAKIGGDSVTYAEATANSLIATGVEGKKGSFVAGGDIKLNGSIVQANRDNVEVGAALTIGNKIDGDSTTVGRANGNTIALAADVVAISQADDFGTILQVNSNTLQLSSALSFGNKVGGDLTTSASSVGNALNIRANALTGEPNIAQTNIGASQYSVSMSSLNIAGGDIISSASAIGNSITFASLPVTGG